MTWPRALLIVGVVVVAVFVVVTWALVHVAGQAQQRMDDER